LLISLYTLYSSLNQLLPGSRRLKVVFSVFVSRQLRVLVLFWVLKVSGIFRNDGGLVYVSAVISNFQTRSMRKPPSRSWFKRYLNL